MFVRPRWPCTALGLALTSLWLGARDSHPSTPAVPRALVRADPGHRMPRAAKIAVMVLESRAYEQVIGAGDAPCLNRLARGGALETRYYRSPTPRCPTT